MRQRRNMRLVMRDAQGMPPVGLKARIAWVVGFCADEVDETAELSVGVAAAGLQFDGENVVEVGGVGGR